MLTETFSSHLDEFPADCPEFELYWLLSKQSGFLLRRNLESDGSLIGAGSRVPGGAQAPPELFLAPPEPFEPPLTIEKIMH